MPESGPTRTWMIYCAVAVAVFALALWWIVAVRSAPPPPPPPPPVTLPAP